MFLRPFNNLCIKFYNMILLLFKTYNQDIEFLFYTNLTKEF